MKERIYNILNEIRPDCDFLNSKDFIEDGLLDSFDVMQIMNMLEEEYGVQIDESKLDFKDISSVDNIIKIINERK